MSNPVGTLRLKANARARVLHGHPWVFVNEVEAPLPASFDGEVVECRDRAGRPLGSGIYNSRSQIVWRRFSRERASLDQDYFHRAVERAKAHRDGLGTPFGEVRRLIWSEADDLPGVVVDQYADTLVVQIQTLAMERRRALLETALDRAVSPREIIYRQDGTLRRLEGLPGGTFTRSGRAWEPRWMTIDGVDVWLDLQQGQKTGFYLDQRQQHARVARHCAGRRVLDAFCNQGGFALQAARAGATEVLGLDSAEDAIAAARRNAERLGNRAVSFSVANVFDWFNAPVRQQEPAWDVIILDPPPFAKSKSALEGALRGYKEINLRAMQRLVPGGLLATYTCSHHMQDAELRGVLADAATDARRRVTVVEYCHQPPDHPVLVTMAESEYLRGYLLRVD
ncbi:MAG: class I SAM-dependent rRNA methyltransferase [Verrucomicrobia bacterium]|nr:class I SAM-dependent rRNA methyltransferase [Verrucomicrobiota bacterium]